jgi:hypothetical protein
MMKARLATLLIAAAIALVALPGATLASARAADHPRALVFFNSACLTCKIDARMIKAWSTREQRRYSLVGVGFMMSTTDSQQFAHQLGWGFTVQGDPAGRLAGRYHVTSPTVIVLIDGGRVTRIDYARWKTN